MWLQNLVVGIPSYIQDSTAMLKMLQNLSFREGPFGAEMTVVTIDVVGLYISIPHNDMLEAITFFMMLHHLENAPPIPSL